MNNFKTIYGWNSDWVTPALEIYNKTELKRTDGHRVHRAFLNSFAVATCWKDEKLVGLGRMISDGEMYSGIFDVVVDPAFQRQGVGALIMNALIAKAPSTCIYLTSTFGNEIFYQKLGFRKHKTALALYPEKLKNSPYLENI